MAKRAHRVGIILSGIGLAVLLGFGSAAVGSAGELLNAQLQRQQNPGNGVYDLQVFIATVRLGFIVAGAASGGLIALNGATWLFLGAALRRPD